jgi:hypothetical protein
MYVYMVKNSGGNELSWKKFVTQTIKNYTKYIIIGTLIIIAVVIISIKLSAISSENCKANSTSIPTPLDNKTSLTSLKYPLKVHIGRLNYAPGQIVDISGSVFNSTTVNNTKSIILIALVNQTADQSVPWCYRDLPERKITHFVSIPTTNLGMFNYTGLRNEDIGKYLLLFIL